MDPLHLTGRPVRPPLPGDGWSTDGPPIVHDGDDLSALADLPPLELPCPSCEQPVTVDVGAVLSASSLTSVVDEPWGAAVAASFGFDVLDHGAGLRSVVDGLGLSVHPVRTRCPACGQDAVVMLGHGEFQPCRWVTVLDGVAAVSPRGAAPGRS